MEVKKAKIVKIGGSYGFIIPKSYVDNDLLNTTDSYNLEIKKAGDLDEVQEQKGV